MNKPIAVNDDNNPTTIAAHDALAVVADNHYATRMRRLYAFLWCTYREMEAAVVGDEQSKHHRTLCSYVSQNWVLERMRRDAAHGAIDPLSVLAYQNADFVIEEHHYYPLLGRIYSVAHLYQRDPATPCATMLSAMRGYSREKHSNILGKPAPPMPANVQILVDVYLQINELLYELAVVLQKRVLPCDVDHRCFAAMREYERYEYLRYKLGYISHVTEVQSAHMALNMFTGMSTVPKANITPNHRAAIFDPSRPTKNSGMFENENPLHAYNNDPYVYQAFVGYAGMKIMEKDALITAYKILGELVACAVMCAS